MHCILEARGNYALHTFISSLTLRRMTWSEQLRDFTALEIVEALGCPRVTAYQWKDGKREPPEWQQPHWLKVLKAWKKAS